MRALVQGPRLAVMMCAPGLGSERSVTHLRTTLIYTVVSAIMYRREDRVCEANGDACGKLSTRTVIGLATLRQTPTFCSKQNETFVDLP